MVGLGRKMSLARSCTKDGIQSSSHIQQGSLQIQKSKKNKNTITQTWNINCSATTRDLLPRIAGSAAVWAPWSPMAIDPRTASMAEDFIFAVTKSLSEIFYCRVSICLYVRCCIENIKLNFSCERRLLGMDPTKELSSSRRDFLTGLDLGLTKLHHDQELKL